MKRLFKLWIAFLLLVGILLPLVYFVLIPRLPDLLRSMVTWQATNKENTDKKLNDKAAPISSTVLSAKDGSDGVIQKDSIDRSIGGFDSVTTTVGTIGVACTDKSKIVIISEKDADRILHSNKAIQILHRGYNLMLIYMTLQDLEKKVVLGEHFSVQLDAMRSMTKNMPEIADILSNIKLSVVKTEAAMSHDFTQLASRLEKMQYTLLADKDHGHSWINKFLYWGRNIVYIRQKVDVVSEQSLGSGQDLRLAGLYLSQHQYDKFLTLMRNVDTNDVNIIKLVQDVENIATISQAIDRIHGYLREAFVREHSLMRME